MAVLRYRDEHNKVGYLQKPKGSDDYHQVLNFLRDSHIRSPELGPPTILATIDETPYTITEDSVRSQLQLADDGGIDDLPIADIYSGMDNLGTKSGSWDQFGSSLDVALIYLSDKRKFNWSSYIFKGMVSNIGNAKKFLMYPRFLQTIFGIETSVASQYRVFKLSSKLFANMKLNFEGQPMPLLAAMLSQALTGEGARTDDEPFTSTNVEDESLGGSFHASPPSFYSCAEVGQESQSNGGKPQAQEKEGGWSDSNQDEGGEQTVDLDALIALANAAVTVDSNIPPGGPLNDPAISSHIPSSVPTDVDFAPAHSTSPSRDPFKGKGVTEPSSPVSKRTKKQLADERLSEIEATRLEALKKEIFEKEKAKIARQDEIYAKQLEQEEEMLSSELLGADVNDDNFAERMVALINQRKRAFAEQTAKAKRDRPMTPAQQREYMRVFVKNQSTTIYSTGWSMKYVKSLANEQLIAEFEKIRMAVADLNSNELRMTMKRAGEAIEPDTLKKQKSTKAPITSVPDVPQPKVVSSSKSSGTRRKSLGRSRIAKPELDLDADDKTFIKVVSDEDSEDEAPILWSTFASWEDLLKLYGLVVKYYENHPITGAGLMLWGDLQISSWRLYTLSNVHVLETVSGEVLYMFADVSYPLSVKLMERMLKHKLEIAKDLVGNDMTTTEQLIRFIKNQLTAAQVSPA
ncbi:hypothetical protein Tco_1176126 [Tanacetum coccineum]